MRTAPRRIALLVLLALTLISSPFSVASAAPEKLVSIEGITEYRLDNGLRILLFPDPATANVTVNLTVFVGSRHEGYGETGMAHLLEHMVFKGTPTHPNVPKVLQEHGAVYNGTTWVDRTNYFETMSGTDANLEFALKLEADRLVNSLVRREDLVSEMTVVRNEFERGENDPGNILSQRMMAVAYEWHNYGKSTIGNRSDIERVPIENLQAFYRRFYQPDNAMVIVAGKFDEKKALEWIDKYFGAIKKPARKLDTTYTEEPAQDGERTVVLRRVGKVGMVGALYHVPAGSHEDFAAVQMLNSILTSEPSGRIYQALVPTKKANSVSGASFAWHDPGVLEINAEVDPAKSVDDVRDTMIGILEKLANEKISTEEVERAKARFKRDRDQLFNRTDRLAVNLSEWAALGDWRLFFLHRDRVAKVTPADVQRVAGKYLLASNRTVGIFIPTQGPQRATIPPAPDVVALVKDYKSTETSTQGEVFDPSPENIEKRVQRNDEKAAPRLATLQKKNRGETISVQVTLRFGNEKSLAGQNVAAQFLGPLMSRGTKTMTRQQIQDELAKLGARLSANSNVGALNFSIETNQKNFAKTMEVLAVILASPSFPAEEFDILKRENLDQLKKAQAEPTMLAFRSLQRQLSPYPKDDVRYLATLEEQIARVESATLDQIKDLYAKQVGWSQATVVVVGDAPGQGIDPKLAETLKSLKADVSYQRITRPARTDIAASKEVILTPDKANAFFIAGHNLGITDSDPDYAALVLGNYIFGGSTLSSRLGDRVRQKEGLSYGAVSIFSADAQDKAGRFIFYAICNPANIDKVEKASLEELERFLKDGITQAELDAAKKGFLDQRKVRRANDTALASMLDDGLQIGRTLAFEAELEKKLAGLTVEQVNAAVKKHFDPKKLIMIRAGDFKKQGG